MKPDELDQAVMLLTLRPSGWTPGEVREVLRYAAAFLELAHFHDWTENYSAAEIAACKDLLLALAEHETDALSRAAKGTLVFEPSADEP